MPHTNNQTRGRALGKKLRAALRTRRALWATACVLALSALLVVSGSGGQGASASSRTAAGRTLIESADVHVDDLASDPGLEINLSISETRNDCGKPLNGQICLRYSISRDDMPDEVGYGLIPRSALTVSRSMIMLKTDTRYDPQIKRIAGAGGLISLKWFTLSRLPQPASHSAALVVPSVQGSILGYAIPSTNVTSGVLLYGG